jgi:hypothetical protein
MRTKNLFRTLVAATLAVVTMNLIAQPTGVTTGGTPTVVKSGANFPADHEYVDLVTIGSKMPYHVTPDQNIVDLITSNPTVFFASVYNWTVAAGGTLQLPGSTSGLTADDAANSTPVNVGYFKENDVAVYFTTTGAKTISVQERSENNAGFAVCTGAAENIDVWVQPKPTIGFDEVNLANVNGSSIIGASSVDGIVGGCGVAVVGSTTTIQLPVIVTGSDNYEITYTVDNRHLDGTANLTTYNVATPITTAKLNGAKTYLDLAAGTNNTESFNTTTGYASFNVVIPTTAIAANAYGKWIITLTAITDRVSRKSLSDSAGDLSNVQDPGTILAANTLTIFSLPTPTTGKINHVNNNNTAW